MKASERGTVAAYVVILCGQVCCWCVLAQPLLDKSFESSAMYVRMYVRTYTQHTSHKNATNGYMFLQIICCLLQLI